VHVTERDELPPAIRTLSAEDTARLRRRYPDLQMSLQACRTCRGRKVYRAWNGLDVAEMDCRCEDQFKLHRALLNAGIELNYQRLSWTDCTGVEENILPAVLDYADRADGYVDNGMGLLLHGEKGTGKTLLITLLMKMLLAKGFDIQFVTFQELIDIYTQTWRDTEEKAWFDKRVRNAGILGIDDVGRENKGRMEIVESMFDHIIRARVSAARPTLITTNRSMDEFRTFYQSNVMSLLDESSIKIPFAGEDYRPQLNEMRIREAREGIVRPIVLG
jgi:DNA replication protein DnaC